MIIFHLQLVCGIYIPGFNLFLVKTMLMSGWLLIAGYSDDSVFPKTIKINIFTLQPK